MNSFLIDFKFIENMRYDFAYKLTKILYYAMLYIKKGKKKKVLEQIIDSVI